LTENLKSMNMPPIANISVCFAWNILWDESEISEKCMLLCEVYSFNTAEEMDIQNSIL